MRALAAALMVVLLAVITPPRPAVAQDVPSGTSYVTPFPEGDSYKLQTYGDAFAEGLLQGLTEAFADDKRVQVSRRHRQFAGIARADFDEELRAEESRETFHIAVVMVGINDRISIRQGNRERDRLLLGSEEWRAEYGQRVDRLIKTLKKRRMSVYWVGQPIMRRYEVDDPAQTMNDIVRDKAYLNGVKYIDIHAQFADENGNYTPYGPDITGKQRLLRDADGITFTTAGNRKLAHFVEQEIKRDVTQARAERAIPLAGTEAEQKRIAALKPRTPGSEGDTSWKSTITKDGKTTSQRAGAAQAQPADTSNDQKADNGRIVLKSIGANGREQSVTIDIPRPAIPSAVVELVTRRESSDRASQMGDVVADDVGGGIVVLSSITPSGTGPGGAGRRVAPTQTPYYQVLIKGEHSIPKPGRADDFSWPRVDPEIPADPPAVRRLPRSSSPRTPPRS